MNHKLFIDVLLPKMDQVWIIVEIFCWNILENSINHRVSTDYDSENGNRTERTSDEANGFYGIMMWTEQLVNGIYPGLICDQTSLLIKHLKFFNLFSSFAFSGS